MEKEYTKAEEFAVQQFTGMHYSEGRDVKAVCVGMGLEHSEWEKIKEDCSWLSQYELEEIAEYFDEQFIG